MTITTRLREGKLKKASLCTMTLLSIFVLDKAIEVATDAQKGIIVADAQRRPAAVSPRKPSCSREK